MLVSRLLGSGDRGGTHIACASSLMATLTGFAVLPSLLAGNALFGFDGVVWSTLAANVMTLTAGALIWKRAGIRAELVRAAT